MDIVKQFMKIGGFKTPQDLEAYGEENFFRDFPEARRYAKGGSIEAYPQTATFDNFFSYGVPPGPQYLKQGGSAYPQAQTEEQFFIPIYTDVYNPYNKAMGGSNVEMYPNAKTTPHWGPTNIFFQDGGEGEQEPEGPDRMGVLNTTGSFVANLKNKANQANNKNAMMNAVSKYGFRNGGPLTKYQDKGAVKPNDNSGSIGPYKQGYKFAADPSATEETGQQPAGTPNYMTKDDFTSSFGTAMDEYLKKIKQMQMEQMMQTYGYNQMPQGNMGNFLDDYFAYTTGSPFAGSTTKGRVRVDGQRAGNFYGNMPLIKGMMPELYGKGNFEDMMNNNADFRNRAEAMGLTGYKEKPFGRREYTFNQRVPYESPTTPAKTKSKTAQNRTDMSVKDLMNMVGKIPNETSTSSSSPGDTFKSRMQNLNDLGYNDFGYNYTSAASPVQPSSEMPAYQTPIGRNVEYENNPGYETPVNPDAKTFESTDPQQRAAMIKGILDGATPDSFDDMLPEQKFGGSYRQGDVVYMSDDEIAEFIRNGGQIEEMD